MQLIIKIYLILGKTKITTLTYHLWRPLVMETHDPVMETHHLLIETHYHLWKPFLKNKELLFMKTILEI
jgi:hypothetical protein